MWFTEIQWQHVLTITLYTKLFPLNLSPGNWKKYNKLGNGRHGTVMPVGVWWVSEIAVVWFDWVTLGREDLGGSGCGACCLYTQLLWDWHWDHVLLDYWIDQSNQCHQAYCCISVVAQYLKRGGTIWPKNHIAIDLTVIC